MFNKAKVVFLVVVGIFILTFGYLVVQKPKVVMVLNNVDFEFGKIIKAGAEKGFQDFGIDGKVIAPIDGTAKEQRKLLEIIYNEDPDIVIVSPIDASVLPILRRFTVNKDIPVILVNQDENLKTKTAYIGTDNVDMGRKAAALLASQLQPGDEVAVLRGDLSVPAYRERNIGAKTALDEAGIVIVGEAVGISADYNIVESEMRRILTEHPDLNGVFTTQDSIAVHIIEYLKNQGISIPVIGVDGTTKMLALVESGIISSTIAQNPYDMGYLSVKKASKIIKGETVDKIVNTGVDIIIKENAKEKLDFTSKFLNGNEEASTY